MVRFPRPIYRPLDIDSDSSLIRSFSESALSRSSSWRSSPSTTIPKSQTTSFSRSSETRKTLPTIPEVTVHQESTPSNITERSETTPVPSNPSPPPVQQVSTDQSTNPSNTLDSPRSIIQALSITPDMTQDTTSPQSQTQVKSHQNEPAPRHVADDTFADIAARNEPGPSRTPVDTPTTHKKPKGKFSFPRVIFKRPSRTPKTPQSQPSSTMPSPIQSPSTSIPLIDFTDSTIQLPINPKAHHQSFRPIKTSSPAPTSEYQSPTPTPEQSVSQTNDNESQPTHDETLTPPQQSDTNDQPEGAVGPCPNTPEQVRLTRTQSGILQPISYKGMC